MKKSFFSGLSSSSHSSYSFFGRELLLIKNLEENKH
jgi:hypothetical protein